MTDLFRWAGYGDTDTEFGTEPTAFNPLFVYGLDGGEPCLVYTPVGSQTFIGKSPLASPASISGRFAIKLSALPTGSVPIVAPLQSTANGGGSAWRLRVSSTGAIIIDNAANTSVGTSSPLPVGSWALVKYIATATTVKVRIYNAMRGGALIGSELVGTSTFGLADNWRQGQGQSSPVIPTYKLAHVLVTDGTDWVADPEVPDALPPGPRYGIIGDSLTAMSGANGEYLRQSLLAAGISPRSVYLWGVGGKRIAVADLTGKTSAQNIQDAKNVLTTIDHWVVALGTNDRPQNDATVNAAIDTILSSIGGSAKVTWIGLTSKGSASADDIRVNGLVQAKLAARGNAVFADWNAHIRAVDGGDVNSPLWISADTTHLSALGYMTERAPFMVDQLVEAPAAVTGTGALSTAAATASGIGTRAVPTSTGSGSVTIPAVEAAGQGAAAVPVFTGNGAAVAPAVQAVGLGTGAPPVFVAAGALETPAVQAAGVGTVDNPAGSTGSGALLAPAISAAGSGSHTKPSTTGVGALFVAALQVLGSGTFAGPPRTGAGNLASPLLVVSGAGTAAGIDPVIPPAPSIDEPRAWPSRAPGAERPYVRSRD